MFFRIVLFAVGFTISFLTLPTNALSYSLDFSGNLILEITGGVPSELENPIHVTGNVELNGPPDFTSNGNYWPSADSISGSMNLDQAVYNLNSYSTISYLLVSDNVVFPDSFSLILEFESLDGLVHQVLTLTFVSDSDWLTSQEDFPPDFNFFDLTNSGINLFDIGEPFVSYNGPLTDVDFRRVPLPATLWLLMSSIVGLGFSGRFASIAKPST